MSHLDAGLLGHLSADVSWDGSADFTGDFLALLRLHLSGHLGALFSGNVLAVFFLHLKTKHSLSASTARHKRTKTATKRMPIYKAALLLLPVH